jgi:hypothetical protein
MGKREPARDRVARQSYDPGMDSTQEYDAQLSPI